MTLCEREFTASTEYGKTSRALTDINYGKRFESGSCWRPEDSAEDVELTSADGGRTRLNETERAFGPVDIYHDYLDLTPKGTRSRWYYNLTYTYQGPGDSPPVSDRSFNSMVEDLAILLTDYKVNKSSHNAIGKAYLPEVTVHVQWPWIALPTFLELATVVLFLSTVFYNHHIKVPRVATKQTLPIGLDWLIAKINPIHASVINKQSNLYSLRLVGSIEWIDRWGEVVVV